MFPDLIVLLIGIVLLVRSFAKIRKEGKSQCRSNQRSEDNKVCMKYAVRKRASPFLWLLKEKTDRNGNCQNNKLAYHHIDQQPGIEYLSNIHLADIVIYIHRQKCPETKPVQLIQRMLIDQADSPYNHAR